MQLGHAPAVQVLPAPHGVGEMNAPIITIIDICQCSGDATFGHHGMSLAKQRFGNYRDFHTRSGGFCGRPQARSTRSNYQDVMFVREIFGH
jgi:hypothetical protein